MRQLVILFAIIFSVSAVQAQNRVGISEIILATDQGDQPGFEFFIPDATASSVLNAWNKFHKPFGAKPKQDKSQRNYYFSDNANITELSENTIDIYTRIYETSEGVRFACAFDLGGVFISSRKTADKFQKAKLLLNKFYAQIAMDAIIAEIELELQALEEIKAEYEKIDEEIANYESEAETYREAVSEATESYEELDGELLEKEDKLNTLENDLSGLESELKAIDKQGILADLTDFNNDLKKVTLEMDKTEKDIDRKEAEIAALEAEIMILKNDLDEQKTYKFELEGNIIAIEERLESLKIEEKEESARLLENNIRAIETAKSNLEVKRSSAKRKMTTEKSKLEKVQEAIEISKETRKLLEDKLNAQQEKLKELEDLKATIE